MNGIQTVDYGVSYSYYENAAETKLRAQQAALSYTEAVQEQPKAVETAPVEEKAEPAPAAASRDTYFNLLENGAMVRHYKENGSKTTETVLPEGTVKWSMNEKPSYNQIKDIAELSRIHSVNAADSFIMHMNNQIRSARFAPNADDTSIKQNISEMQRVIQQAQVKMNTLLQQQAVGSVNILL